MTSLIPREVLSEDHTQLDHLLKTLVAALADAAATSVYEAHDLFWARLALHIRAENLQLFPTVLGAVDEARKADRNELPLETAEDDIETLRADHDFFMRELASAGKKIRGLPESPDMERRTYILRDLQQSMRQLRVRIAVHNQLEEERIYKLATVLLDERQQSILADRINRELQNKPPRFS